MKGCHNFRPPEKCSLLVHSVEHSPAFLLTLTRFFFSTHSVFFPFFSRGRQLKINEQNEEKCCQKKGRKKNNTYLAKSLVDSSFLLSHLFPFFLSFSSSTLSLSVVNVNCTKVCIDLIFSQMKIINVFCFLDRFIPLVLAPSIK